MAADDGRRAGLEALVIRQDDLAFEVPGLDGHFLEIMLDGRHSGFAVTDGLATGPVAEHRPGRLSFLPGGRSARVYAEGSGRYLQLVIDPSLMRATMRELLAGDPDTASLYAFNTLVNPRIEELVGEVARSLLCTDLPVAACDVASLRADELARRLCVELVRDYSDGRLAGDDDDPSLTPGQLLRIIERIETDDPGTLRLESLAECVSLTPTRLALGFEAETGQTLPEFMAERKLDRARAHLDRHPVVDEPDAYRAIAERHGFGDERALDAAFRRSFGVGVRGYAARRKA